jgi:hypothetical protein
VRKSVTAHAAVRMVGAALDGAADVLEARLTVP